jgi:UDP-4-amino-4,6-dideoxy-N-acetyl-beta-L-altrosamine transaminase
MPKLTPEQIKIHSESQAETQQATRSASESLIPYGRQSISPTDIEAVVDVLRSDWLTQGPAIARFELAVAQACGARYAVAVSSATAGLHIACLAAGLKPGDRLWTVPNTFVASANCGRYCGAEVDFVDIHPQTYNMDVAQLQAKLETARMQNRLPQVVVPVHFAGQSCEMAEIHALSQEYGFQVIEDAAHAIGGQYRNQPIGSGTYSEMTVFSFHPVKIITTGEGGMVLTNREDLYQQLLRLRSHGITRDENLMNQPIDGAWAYQQLELGFNYRMTDLQAALGTSQMQRLDEFIVRRRALVKRYDQQLAHLPVILPAQHPDTNSAWHLYVIQVDAARCSKSRREVFDYLRAKQIGVQVHYIPVHTQPYYQALGFKAGDYPQAETYYAQAISLPLYADLTEVQQDRVIQTLAEALA